MIFLTKGIGGFHDCEKHMIVITIHVPILNEEVIVYDRNHNEYTEICCS